MLPASVPQANGWPSACSLTFDIPRSSNLVPSHDLIRHATLHLEIFNGIGNHFIDAAVARVLRAAVTRQLLLGFQGPGLSH